MATKAGALTEDERASEETAQGSLVYEGEREDDVSVMVLF